MRSQKPHGRSCCLTCLRRCSRTSFRAVGLPTQGSQMMCKAPGQAPACQRHRAAANASDITTCCVMISTYDLTISSSHRTGICLQFVCKDFRSALQDLQHVRLWGIVDPMRCVSEHAFEVRAITPERTLSLREWLQARAAAVRALHIRWARTACAGHCMGYQACTTCCCTAALNVL
jgi:hypothetical protein